MLTFLSCFFCDQLEHNTTSELNLTVSLTKSLNTPQRKSPVGDHLGVLKFIREILQSWGSLLPTCFLSHSNLFLVPVSKYLNNSRESWAVIFCFAFNLFGKDGTSVCVGVHPCVCGLCVPLHLLQQLSPQPVDPLHSTTLYPPCLCVRRWCWTHRCSTCIFSTVTTLWKRRMLFYRRKKMRGLVLSCVEPKVSYKARRHWNLLVHSVCAFQCITLICSHKELDDLSHRVHLNQYCDCFSQQHKQFWSTISLFTQMHSGVCACMCVRERERACRPSGSVILGRAVCSLSHLFIAHGVRL